MSEAFSKHRFIASKIIRDDISLDRLVARYKFKSHQIVFTNGCFDLLHKGHVDYLNKAADLGDRLIVGINSDASVKSLGKGKNRPIQDEESRALIIASLHYVDQVVIFNELTPERLIQQITPDVLVKGADYQIKDIVGAEHVLNSGGSVERIEFLEGYSTSLIEQKILKDGKA